MSRNCQKTTSKNSFSVLPDIVVNYKTTMCNPYEKRKVTTNRSKIPVPKTSTIAKSAVAKKSIGLPAGFLGLPTQRELKSFKIPKLNSSNFTKKNNAIFTSHSGNKSRPAPLVSRKTTAKVMTDRSSRKPTTHVPKVSQPLKRGPHTTTTNPKVNVVNTTKIAATTTVTANKPQQVQQRQGPWPYGIPPCSRYTVKWGDPAYTGSYVEGEWCYDVVGAAPKPMDWPDMSDMFPDIPKGIFELRTVEPCAVPPELSSTEGMKKIKIIDFHLISSGLVMEVRLSRYLHKTLWKRHQTKDALKCIAVSFNLNHF